MKYSHPPKEWKDYINFTDNVLNEEELSPALLAHPFLHPTKPTFIIKILTSLKNTNILNKFSIRLKFYYYVISLIKDIFSNFLIHEKNYLKPYEKQYDYIFISHLNNEERLSSEIDDYYGEIITDLSIDNNKVLLILIPHCNITNSTKKEYFYKKRNFDTYIFNNKNVSSKDKINFLRFTLKTRRIFLKKAKLSKNFKQRLYEYSADTFLSPGYILNILCGIQLKNILKRNKNTKLITTFEGHGWERLFYYHAKLTNNKIKCIGFQHTLFFKFNHSLTREINKSCDPDLILCSGELSKVTLDKKLSNKIKIDLLGSPKFIYSKVLKKNKKDIILFIPSGEEEEAIFITNFAYNFAIKNKKHEILIRYHPVIAKKFKNKFNYKISNFNISDNKLVEDCQISKWVLYSSSTAIYEAIYEGCIPIRLNCKLIYDLSDPLWQINSKYIFKINSVTQLKKIIKATNNFEYIIKSFRNLSFLINKLSSKLNLKVLENC